MLLDGPAMSDLELYLFFSLLFSAGAETTRNAVAGGLAGAGRASGAIAFAA